MVSRLFSLGFGWASQRLNGATPAAAREPSMRTGVESAAKGIWYFQADFPAKNLQTCCTEMPQRHFPCLACIYGSGKRPTQDNTNLVRLGSSSEAAACLLIREAVEEEVVDLGRLISNKPVCRRTSSHRMKTMLFGACRKQRPMKQQLILMGYCFETVLSKYSRTGVEVRN